MKNKFIKNLYQVISLIIAFLFVYVIFVISIIISNYQYKILVLLSLLLLFILMFIIFGAYFIFQIVIINETGIYITLFNKTIKMVLWDEIEGITENNFMNNPIYMIVLKNQKIIRLDKRKKIKIVIEKYSNIVIKDINPN